MLFKFSSSFLIKNYISIQNLLNNTRIIENQYKDIFHYYFHFNRNKQITISVITNKFFTFIKITHINYIFFVLITFTFIFSVSFTYSNHKFDSIAIISEI